MVENRSGLDDVALGPIRPSLTAPGKAITAGLVIAGILCAQLRSPVALGPVIALVALAFADFLLSRRMLQQTAVNVAPTVVRAAAPNGLSYTVTGPVGTAIRMRMFGMVPFEDEHVLTGERLTLRAEPGQTSNQMFVNYRISRCAIGLVPARREVVRLTTTPIIQAPAVHDGQVPQVPSARIEDLERIREYVPGDRRNRISWSATARTGVLQVRDDLVVNDQVVIVVDLGEQPAGREAMARRVTKAASMARLCIEQAWADGYEPRLLSWHDTDANLRLVGLITANAVDPAFSIPSESEIRLAYFRDEVVADVGQMIERVGGLAYAGEPLPLPAPPYLHISKEGVWRAD